MNEARRNSGYERLMSDFPLPADMKRRYAPGLPYTDQKNHLRSVRYGAAQTERIFSGSRQTFRHDSVAASSKAS
jgi:hypothetical protein